MWFKQLTIYRLPDDKWPDVLAFEAALAAKPFTPVVGLDWFSEGYAAPCLAASDGLIFGQKQHHLFALKREDKVLPAGVIRDFLEAKVQDIEEKEQRKVGRKEKIDLKEQIIDDLLPRCFTRSSRTVAYLDLARGLLMVNATGKRADTLIGKIFEAYPEFRAALLKTNVSPALAMTEWLLSGVLPTGFALDDDCELKEAKEQGAVIRCRRMDLSAKEIAQHVEMGKQVSQLGLIWNDSIRFLLNDALQIKRIQFLDMLQEEVSSAGEDKPLLMGATLLIMGEALGDLTNDLLAALGNEIAA
jgi:recombination associated protein RdgC